jgi:hypothetical protein
MNQSHGVVAMRPNRSAIVAFSCAAIALSAAPLAHAQDKTVELKISSWVPPAHSLTAAS